MRPEHLFVSSSGGALYDTRVPNWSAQKPLRSNFECHHGKIRTVADLKATLRAGPYAWPGGYQLFLLCDDGATLSFESARKEVRNIMSAIQDNRSDGWHVVACDINYEDSNMVCAHSGEPIPAAYGDDSDGE